MDKETVALLIGLVLVVAWCFYDSINKWNTRK